MYKWVKYLVESLLSNVNLVMDDRNYVVPIRKLAQKLDFVI